LRILRMRLGRLIRDIGRKIAGHPDITSRLRLPARWRAPPRSAPRSVGWNLYSFHASETAYIGKGKGSAPYECGVKVSIVTTNACTPGGQFVLHARHCPAILTTGTPSGMSSRISRTECSVGA
jgi:IS5 family transposase